MKRTLNIAHRGFSGIYPENTMLAFKKAVEVQCNGIETDVQLTKDGVAVICHNEKLDRTTDGSGFIKNYTYLELSKLDAGVKKDHKFSGCKIPTLDEFLDYIKDKNIDINVYTVNEEEDMMNMINLGVDGIITNYPDRLKDILLKTNI
ncbi:glycerophosphodiester phosphodiesterase family protein [Clostridium sp. OS1-26]|uniref:glycerophosphodiester phosphodiesterase family protein n=1 Tax=Clostridium sp. OS1-26 TaxID=3070681 RepID=UPI0027E1758D|nr:glycerophosphodiester phosphodiesterase family protein [Clostridium sp. OS1-26]WML36851.1 glycerophosphodiester phosphodiesterase family protein [Clostridium sp. OS1-26]